MKTEEKEYSIVTNELLERIKFLRYSVASNYIPGDKEIIRGIDLFETILKEINPEHLDKNMQIYIESIVDKEITKINDQKQSVNHNMNYGIVCCYTILEGYNKTKQRNLKKHWNIMLFLL